MARSAIPVVVVSANAINDGADPIELADLGIAVDATNDHTLNNPTGKTVLLAILDGVQATVTLSIPTIPTAGDTMTIGIGAGQKVYTFRATADFDADGEVEILGTAALCRTAIIEAIMGTDGVNTAHTQVTAAAATGNDITLTAIDDGVIGNVLVSTETFTAGGNIFSGAVFSGGVSAPSVQMTIVGVDDPYGRGASPDGDLVETFTGRGVYLLGRYSPSMFNQAGASVRKVNVNAASVTGAAGIKLVALSY